MLDARYILAGQSNALGFLNNGPAPYTPTERVQLWCDTDGDGVHDAWRYMLPGCNTGTLVNPDVWGPEVQFANRWLAANPIGTLWLVKSCKGSTGLAVDAGVDWSPASTGELFDLTKDRTAAAKAALDGGPNAFTGFDAVLWMQGEQDALTEAAANAYQTNLEVLIAAVREEWLLSAPGRFVLGRITDSVNLPYSLGVRVAQWAVPLEDENAFSFKTIGFPMREDLIHYDAQGHIRLGNAFYDAVIGP